MKLFFTLSFGLLCLLILVKGQEELPASGDGSGEASGEASGDEASGSGSGDEGAVASGGDEGAEAEEAPEEESGSGDEEETPAEEEGGEEGEDEEGEDEEEGEEEEGGEEEGDEEGESSGESGSGEEDIDDILTPKDEEASGEEGSNEGEEGSTEGDEESDEGSEESDMGSCDVEGMDEKVSGCLSDFGSRISKLEGTISSEEGGGLEDQIELVLVKKGVIDCENDTQCDDDRACMESRVKRDRVLCEDPCERNHCPVQHSECVVREHKFACECKEGFHGNGTERCVPDGFTAEENGKHYRIFDDSYVTFDNATQQCQELGARLPVLDSLETIKIVKKYLEQSNFTVFEQWDRSSRRVWLGLVMSPRMGLVWMDGARITNYPVSSRLFVWEARRALSVESSYADNSRHYGFYIDGDIAKLPGGGRKGAAVLCELLSQTDSPTAPRPQNNYPANYNPQPQQNYPGRQPQYPSHYPQPQQQQPPPAPPRQQQGYNNMNS